LQHVGQDLPAACSEPVTAAKANAIAVMSDFIIISFFYTKREVILPKLGRQREIKRSIAVEAPQVDWKGEANTHAQESI
jgi:hypothetical protein